MIPTTEMIPAVTTEMIPGILGMELRGLQKLDNNLARASYLFYLYCIFFTVCNLLFTALYFAVNCFFFWCNTRQHLFKRCNSLMSSISSNFFIFLQENLLKKIELKQNKSNLEIRLCLPDDVMTTVMTSVTGSHYNTCFPISFGTCTSCCSCHLKSLTS